MSTTIKQRILYEKGFTIVELLIVIVVIGILAAIVTVAYGMIIQRAQTAQYIAAADTWEKILRVQYALDGTLPTAYTDPICLGSAASNFPATADLQAGRCVEMSGGASSAADFSQTFADGITRASPPSGALPYVTFTAGSITLKARGIAANIYEVNGGYQVIFYFYIPAGSNCGHAQLIESFGNFSACQLGVEIN